MHVSKYHIILAVGTTDISPAIFFCLIGREEHLQGERVRGKACLLTVERASMPQLESRVTEPLSRVSLVLYPSGCPVLHQLHESFPDIKLSKMGEETHPAACNQEMPREVGGGTHPQ